MYGDASSYPLENRARGKGMVAQIAALPAIHALILGERRSTRYHQLEEVPTK